MNERFVYRGIVICVIYTCIKNIDICSLSVVPFSSYIVHIWWMLLLYRSEFINLLCVFPLFSPLNLSCYVLRDSRIVELLNGVCRCIVSAVGIVDVVKLWKFAYIVQAHGYRMTMMIIMMKRYAPHQTVSHIYWEILPWPTTNQQYKISPPILLFLLLYFICHHKPNTYTDIKSRTLS